MDGWRGWVGELSTLPWGYVNHGMSWGDKSRRQMTFQQPNQIILTFVITIAISLGRLSLGLGFL